MEIAERDVKIIEKETSMLIRQADSYSIESAQDVDSASEFLREVKGLENRIEAKRLTFTKPLNQSLKAINETFKELSKPLVAIGQSVTNRILDWRRAENDRLAKEEERRRKIQEAHEKAGHEVKAPVILERPEKRMGDTQARKVWTWEVVNFSELEDKYKEENTVAINQAIRDGVRTIKGLRIFQEEKLSIIQR